MIDVGALSLLVERGQGEECAASLEKQHRKMEKCCRSIQLERRESDLFAFIELDRDFHSIIYSTLGNARLQGIWNGVSDEMVWYGMLAMITLERFFAVLEEHAAIIEGLRKNDGTAIASAVRNHLNVTAQRIRNIMENKKLFYINSGEETE